MNAQAHHEQACIFLGGRRHSYSSTICISNTFKLFSPSLRSFGDFAFRFVELTSSPLSICTSTIVLQSRPLIMTCTFRVVSGDAHSPISNDHTKLLANQYGRSTPRSDPASAILRS